jgi:REP element-mobilizing transposase RayT
MDSFPRFNQPSTKLPSLAA